MLGCELTPITASPDKPGESGVAGDADECGARCAVEWVECVECADAIECVDCAVCGDAGISSAPALARRLLRACSDSEANGSAEGGLAAAALA